MQSLGTATVDSLNTLLKSIGGQAVAGAGGGFQSGNNHGINWDTDGYASGGGYAGNARSGALRVGLAVTGLLKSAQIIGGDIYMKRTVARSSATDTQTLFGELQIAQDYRRYLANKDIIDNIIALDPKSAFVRPAQARRPLRRVASFTLARDSGSGRAAEKGCWTPARPQPSHVGRKAA